MTRELLVEVGTEELPASAVVPAAEALRDGLLALLEGVEHGPAASFCTPRRLAVAIPDVAAARQRSVVQVLGPSLEIARKDGSWTRAAEGFARGKGLTVDDLEIVEGPRGAVIAARSVTGGESTHELVAAGLARVIAGLPFKKSMRWDDSGSRSSRPVRGVLCQLHGSRVHAEVGALTTTTVVHGHRRSRLGPAEVATGADYLSALRGRWVIADRAERSSLVVAGLEAVAAQRGVICTHDAALLEEVVDLVEWPVVIASEFDAELLELPARLLRESMRVHQRVFATTTRDGSLSNTFLVVTNAPQGDAAVIAAGNRRVLAARFHDARFFYAEDRKRSLASFVEKLAGMRWVRQLGTMRDKQERLEVLVHGLAPLFGADPHVARRAAALCKADLVSDMVGEFPELQGHMGRLYAEHAGEPGDVALAIEEHHLPAGQSTALPRSPAGRALAVADRLDTLAGCFGVELVPRGSADPQGLRRAAMGVVSILLDARVRCRLGDLFEPAVRSFARYGVPADAASTVQALVDFTLARLKSALLTVHPTEVVEAVFDAGGQDPVQLQARVLALEAVAGTETFRDLVAPLKRVLNITRDVDHSTWDPAVFQDPAEHALAKAFLAVRDAVASHLDHLRVAEALEALASLKPFVDTYFERVLVNAEEPRLRSSRLGLLRALGQAFLGVADLRRISTDARVT